MKKLLDVLPWALFVLAMGSLIYLFNSMQAKVEKANHASNIVAMKELEGKVFHWTYPSANGDQSGVFHALIKDRRLFFECVEGKMKGTLQVLTHNFLKLQRVFIFFLGKPQWAARILLLRILILKKFMHM